MHNKRHYRGYLSLLLIFFFHTYTSFAQTVLRGVVTDAQTGMPVEMANVQLLRGNGMRLVGFTLTDTAGKFTLPAAGQTDSLRILVSLLGYKAEERAVYTDESVHFSLVPEVFDLREIEVRPGRVWGRQDTINYEVGQFISPNDEAIKDVIKKLPGINVDDTGRISYNGKDISNFYVEGMDITDGRYNQINNNLNARAVEKVQVLENHQPVRLLRDKIRTEDIAINLKLREEFRDKWMTTLRGGAGLSVSSLLWDVNLYALQLSRKSQSTYGYKANNRGVDVTEEMARLTDDSFNHTTQPAAPAFLALPSLEAPLKKEKLLFNNMHILSANRIYKFHETAKLRVNAAFTHDERKQERGSETTYYQAGDSLRIAEESRHRLRSDRGELSLSFENNADNHYLTNRFFTTGEWENARSRFAGNRPADQNIHRKNIQAGNDFKNLWNKEAYTFEIQSYVRYTHLPTILTVDDDRQRQHTNQLYTDHSFSVFRKSGIVSHRYRAGIKGELNNIRNGYTPYLTSNWQITYNKWQAFIHIPVAWACYPGSDFSRVSLNPSLALFYKYNYAWRFSGNISYRESYGNLLNFYDTPYRTNYLHTVRQAGELNVNRQHTYSIYGEYKNTIQEFFATLTAMHTRNRADQIQEQQVTAEQITLISHQLPNDSYSWSIQGTLSKSFYDWRLKTALNYQFVLRQDEMISRGERLALHSRFMYYEPRISWSPGRKWELSYEGNFRYGGNRIGNSTHSDSPQIGISTHLTPLQTGGSTRLAPLWNIVQKLDASYSLFPIDIHLSANHYYNDVNESQGVSALFFDARLRWDTGGFQWELSVNNLLDKRQYGYTQYNSLQSYTSWIQIRGREYMISGRYRF